MDVCCVKKSVSFILVFVMIISCILSVNAKENLLYEYEVKDGVGAIITGYNGTSTELFIPDSIDGYTVVGIGDDAFDWCEYVTKVTIPQTVKTIGNNAFFCCTSLVSVNLPDSLEFIGDNAFNGTSIDSVVIPESVKIIGDFAFSTNRIREVVIPKSIKRISMGMFMGCNQLEKVTIPDSVTEIGNNAFYECTGIKNIAIPNSVVRIGDSAFSQCKKLEVISVPESVEYIGNYSFYYCKKLKKITIPNPYCEIYDSKDTIPQSIEITGYINSTAHKYAKKYGMNFVSLGEIPDRFNIIFGDVDGDKLVSVMDATAIQQYKAQKIELDSNAIKAADTDKDSEISVMDATRIQLYIAKKIDKI